MKSPARKGSYTFDMKTTISIPDSIYTDAERLAQRLEKSRMQTVQAPLDSGAEQEEKQRAGYLRKPVKKGEFDIWEGEQAWDI